MSVSIENLTAKDFKTDQEVKWCPGCGDYVILKQMQSLLPSLGIKRENTVFISGIGCSSRFPYYMNTYGIHSIHGRAPSIATGLKLANPDLDVWIITGDGDALSIGGNHLIHLLRRNLNVNLLLFNNEIYGLTKGQYSPTSQQGLKTKSSPLGAIDYPFNPLSLALGAQASFVARGIDREPKHLLSVLKEATEHKGTSFVEIYQNCIVFNDGVFDAFYNKETKLNNSLFLTHAEPMVFGSERQFGIRLDGLTPRKVLINEQNLSLSDLMIHDKHDRTKADIVSRFFDDPLNCGFPRPFGVIYQEHRTCYEDAFFEQQEISYHKGDHQEEINKLMQGKHSWVVI